MDYIDFQVRRIADNLRRVGVSVPGDIPTPAAIGEPQQETEFTIAQGHKSTIYLPHWIQDHRDDPAVTVSPSGFTTHISNLIILAYQGVHGPPPLSPP